MERTQTESVKQWCAEENILINEDEGWRKVDNPFRSLTYN
jgi:hypothetical protein